jgi:hypothetical protein
MRVHHIPILIYSPPQVMLLTIDLQKRFVNVEGVAITSVLSLQSAGVNSAEFNAPKPDCFAANSNSSLRKEILSMSRWLRLK